MGTTDIIDGSVRGEEKQFEKEKRDILLKKEGIKSDDELVKEISKDYDIQIPEKKYPKEDEEEINFDLKEIYDTTKEILKEFIDTKDENYEIISLWILGTWMHRNFETYPYLFINAMKGSGKTRLLKLIKELSWEGDMLASLSEAVLFRTTGTLCIDEFEHIGNKDKNALRELLNTAYKKGNKVKRMKKKKMQDEDGHMCEQQVVEEFDTFRPIVMANIWGMEEVLEDRCISIILERSANKSITRKIENFSSNPKFIKLKEKLVLSSKSDVWCSDVCSRNIYNEWNTYIDITTLNNTIHTTTLNNTTQHLFEDIYKTEIDGRNLELSFSILLIADRVGCLDKIVEILKNIVSEKKEEDIMEGRDIMLYDFVSKREEKEEYRVSELTTMYKQFIGYEPEDEKRNWLNHYWFGKALKRLNLVLRKRKTNEGRSVILNVKKAKEKMEIFK